MLMAERQAVEGWGKDVGEYGHRHRPLLGSSLGQLARVPSPRPLPYPSLRPLWRAPEHRSPAARAERAGVVLVCGGRSWSGWGLQGGQRAATWETAYLRGVKWEKRKEEKGCECEYTSQQTVAVHGREQGDLAEVGIIIT